MSDTLYLDIENDGDRLLMVGWALNDGPVKVDLARRYLADPSVVKVTQSDHDLRWFLMHGWKVAGPWFDTKVMAWVLDENQPLDQESLTKRYVGHRYKVKRLTQHAGRVWFDGRWPLDEYDKWPDNTQENFQRYNAEDVETLRLLYKELREGLRHSEFEEYWLREEVPYSSLILNMEVRGLPIDLDATNRLAVEVRDLRDEAEARLREMSGLPESFNLNSPDQLRLYLFTKWFTFPDRLPMDTDPLPSDLDFEVHKVGQRYIHGVWKCRGRGLAPTPPPRKKVGPESHKPSTASPELLYKHGRDPFVQVLCQDYRRMDKLLGTYLDKFPVVANKGRIYGRFNQTGTVTGRLSSSDPNLQNIPARRDIGKRVRGLFRGSFIIGDYDALEMRLMAHFSGDRRLLDVFRTGGDPHALTAQAVFGYLPDHDDPKRDMGKTLNYAIGYGAGPRTLAKSMALAGYPTDESDAREYLAAVETFYPRLFRWGRNVIFQARKSGGVSTIGGRRRHLYSEHAAGWKDMKYAERQALNTVVQGSAADVFRRTLLQSERLLPELRLLAQVHDEAIWEYGEVPTGERLAFLQRVMEQGHDFKLKVPLVFVPAVCSDWSQK